MRRFNLQQVTSQASPYWDSLVRIYLLSFPVDEQRPVESILRLLAEEPRYTLYAVIDDNTKPIGLLTTWTFETFTYIEHFALSPEVRGQGHGSEALKMLIAQNPRPLILEAEPPTDELTRRRIRFYERSGLTLYDYPYVQPAYTADSQPVPLCLMGTLDTQGATLDQVSRTLHREVYRLRNNRNNYSRGQHPTVPTSTLFVQ